MACPAGAVRRGRRLCPGGGEHPRDFRLPGFASGPCRQCRAEPVPARHLRRVAGVRAYLRQHGRRCDAGALAPSAQRRIAAHWREPGRGIWEMHSAPRHYVHSKAMAWAGLQRALWLQRRHDLAGDGERWSRESERIRREVMRLGISRDGRHFVQAYGEERLDASLLLLARNDFVEGDSEVFGNTVSRIRQSLGADARGTFVRRYQTGTDDGLAGGEGAFVICSFWLVEALVQNGQLEEAEALFERLLELRGEHGLYAEEIDPHSGEQLGNIPRPFPMWA
ncbi:glycoside hydrolase family 15 protein [Azotobacter sp. CWF10]